MINIIEFQIYQSPMKNIQNDTKLNFNFSCRKSPLINPVFDHGLSYYNIKSQKSDYTPFG